jgi:CheY-like chemotaxis protein
MVEEVTILLIEDNPGDVRLVEEAFRDSQFHNELHTVRDGEAALDFVHREVEYEDAPRPDIVLLDLHLPKVDGEDVLHEIKHQSALTDVRVVVLSGLDDDYVESRDLNDDADEDAVLEKPIDPDEFLDVIREFDSYEVSIVRADD